MAEERTDEATSSSQVNSDEATVEVNVKTLDSQIYPFRVNKNMPVSSFKEKVASAIGIPVGRQRLIFRGRVLKDEHLLSEYHVEDGHTLHLVERQPVPSQSSSGANAADNNGNNDNRGYDSSTGGSRGRVGQVSHSVVLRTFNIGGEQGEGIVPDLNRIIGEVLNSAGIGSQTTTAGATNVPSSIPSATPGSEAEGMRGTANTHTHVRNQGQPGQGIFGFPFLPLSQPLQLSFTGATVAVPPQHMVIPDSLTTLLEFINQMELALSVNSGSQSSPPVGAPQRPDNASLNPRGLPTPETLSNVIRRAQQLLSVHAGAALSNIARRLEREGSSTDLVVRDQIQAEAMQVGVAMQHLGALLLELGRTIMTLRMGNSPAELVLNTGPAVYISSSGPNPIMVQPFPFQASSLFGLSSASQSNAAIPGPLSPGDVARNINIHIHAGSRTNAGEGPRSQAPASGNGTRPTRDMPVRSIIAAVPARSPSESAGHAFNVFYPHGSSHPTDPTSNPSQSGLPQRLGPTEHNESQPIMDGAVPETTLQSVSLPIDIDHLHSQNRSVGANMEVAGTLEDSDFIGSLRSSVGGDDGNRNLDQMEVDGDGGAGEIPGSLSAHVSESDGHQVPTNRDVGVSLSMTGSSSATSMGDISCSAPVEAVSSKSEVQYSEMSKDELASTSGPGSKKHQEPLGSDKIVPLGLGSGALEPKRRRQPKTQGKDVRMDLRPANQDEESIARGQQVLQSLVSCGDSNQNRVDNNGPLVQVPHAFRQIMDSLPLGGQSGTNGQFDPASMMSQVIQSPAMNSLITGVSEQAGFGSPDALRGILERITQTPSIRNTLSQIAQQAGGQSQAQELGNTAPGLGMGQGGGLDLSRMLQQLMPVVSQALGGALTGTAPIEEIVTPRDIYDGRNSEIDLRGAVQSIELQEPPGNIFRGVVESASMSGEGNTSEDLIEELCIDDELVNGYIEMLQRDVARRLQSESSSNGDGL